MNCDIYNGSKTYFSDLVNTLAHLFICRDLTQDDRTEMQLNNCSCENNLEQILIFLIDNPYRRDLVISNRFLKPVKPLIPLSKLILELRACNVDPKCINIVITEYLFAEGLDQLGLSVYKTNDHYNFLAENVRVCNIASRKNEVDYIWVLGRSRVANGADFISRYPATETVCQSSELNTPFSYDTLRHFTGNDSLASDCYLNEVIIEYDSFTESEIVSRLDTACAMRHLPPLLHRKFLTLAETIFSLDGKEPGPALDFKLVFCSGLGWSGSSAIYDCLRQSPSCVAPFNRTNFPAVWKDEGVEISTYKNPHNPAVIFDCLEKGALEFKRSLFLFTIANIFSWFWPFNNIPSIWSRIDSAIWQVYCSRQEKALLFLDAVLLLLHNLAYTFINADKRLNFDNSFINFFSVISYLTLGKAHKYCLFDNAIGLYFADRIQGAPHGSIYLMVFREPRDNYISASWYHEYNVDNFINYLKTQFAILMDSYNENSKNYRFIPISYDRFVLDKSYRKQLHDKLDVIMIDDGPSFKPSESAKRIGRWHSYPNRFEMEKVAAAFPELLDLSFLDNFDENFI